MQKTLSGRRRDGLIILLIVIFALLAMWYRNALRQKEGYNFAVVTLDGREIMRIDLANYRDSEAKHISLEEQWGVPVHFELKEGAIRFYEVTCPDHLCEGYGFISREYESAVCLPNRTVVMIYSREEVKQLQIVSK
jgi:hypothetical protein